mmetsp:Transcript_29524/g.44645  ORF Transcript_29524/g.44645 Transcript_29524/m.44645 type:complete len:145 (-) Transcript_29524:253-687(-)
MTARSIFAKSARQASVKTVGSSFVRIAAQRRYAKCVTLPSAVSVRIWQYAKSATIIFAKIVCLFDSVTVVIATDAWIVCYIGIVHDAGSRTVMIVLMSTTSNGVKSAKTNIVMTAVSRITTMESLIARDVEDCCCLESCTKRKP